MRDEECVAFLRWALPRLGLRWAGYRKVRRQVCKRLGRRLRSLELGDLEDYRRHLSAHSGEWAVLDGMCRITISRFFRDRRVYETLAEEVLPELTRRSVDSAEPDLGIWSAGCGAGEEPYSVAMLHRLSRDRLVRDAKVRIVATDSDEHQLDRARRAVFPVGCTRDLPQETRRSSFEELGDERLLLRAPYRAEVELACQDLRVTMPDGPFRLILCRNLAFTYFVAESQLEILTRLHQRLVPGGYLVIGAHERLPANGPPLDARSDCPSILRRA